jgi:hypothetical protein
MIRFQGNKKGIVMDANVEAIGSVAAQRIQALNAVDVLDLCNRFGCTEQELRAAVYAVGGHPDQLKTVFHVSLSERIAVWFRLGTHRQLSHD